MTPLRQRMSDDLHLRNYSDRTIKAYLRCVSNFARHFGKSPDELGPAHIREYQLYLVNQKQCSWAVFNQTVCALRFFYNTTAETQVFISTNRIANISIRRVALLVSEAIDRHREKLHAILEILIHMGCRSPVYIKVSLTKGFRSSFVAGKRTKLIPN